MAPSLVRSAGSLARSLPIASTSTSGPLIFVRTATKAKAVAGNKKATKGWQSGKQQAARGPKAISNEGKADHVKRALYPSDAEAVEQSRLKALSSVVPSIEAHETIHRAYQLFLRRRREAHSLSLSRRYDAMTRALEALRLTDPKLFLETTLKGRLQNIQQPGGSRANNTGKLAGLFPRHLRPPTEEAAPEGKAWNAEWKNQQDPLEELRKERAKRAVKEGKVDQEAVAAAESGEAEAASAGPL